MPGISCYAFAEDVLSCAVMVRLVEYCNRTSRKIPLRFFRGFPENKRGSGNLKKLLPSICKMAQSGLYTLILTDLDNNRCAPELIEAWFKTKNISDNVLFRVAVREIETWLLADRTGLAKFLGIAVDNFNNNPDSLSDPKRHLLDIIRKKGRKRYHRDMLPSGSAHVGPEYNARLCTFVQERWNIDTATKKSLSLQRALVAINKFQE